MVYINASGVRTFLLREGRGETTLILIHGAAWNHRLWSRQIPAISSLTKVIAVDLPGHGGSGQFADAKAISIRSYSDHIHSILLILKEPNVVLVGHSMGGAISLMYALDRPSSVKAMVLIGTGAKLGVNPAILEGLSKHYEETVEASKAWAFATRTDKRIIEEGIGEMLKCSQDVSVGDFKTCNEFDIRDSVSRIEVPTLILVGSEDKLTPVKWSEYMHNKIKGSELKVIDEAGHLVMLEKPTEVNKCIISFIEKIRVR